MAVSDRSKKDEDEESGSASDSLSALGYSEGWAEHFQPHSSSGFVPARVIRSDRGSCMVATGDDIFRAKPSNRLVKSASSPGDLPATGDWVAVNVDEALELPLLEAVMPRTSGIVRLDPSKTSEVQVLAANVDVVFIVEPIVPKPNLRRIERELSLAWDSGATPVVVLTKADLCSNVGDAKDSVEAVAFGVEVIATSALAPDAPDGLIRHASKGRTAVLIGPSGAGKSTLVNRILGEQRQTTCEVREADGRGRHATVARELVPMPNGGLLIDTPGLRSLGMTGSEAGILSTFPDVEELALECRFADCTHTQEPGCAVVSAIQAGTLPAERLDSFHKLMRETAVMAAKTDVRLRAEEKRKHKAIGKAAKEYHKRYDKRRGGPLPRS